MCRDDMAFNPSAPSTKLTVYHKRPTDVAWTNITDSGGINIVADWDGYSAKLSSSKSISLIINNVDGDNDNYFHIGDSIRVFAGFDTVYPQPIIEGKIYPNNLQHGEGRINVTVNDYITMLSYEYLYLSADAMNYNGWECAMAVLDVVEGLNGVPLTFSASGSYDIMNYVVPANEVYGDPISRLDVVKKLMNLMIDVDYVNLYRPMRYHYFQYDDYDGTTYTPRFRIIKETDPASSTANKVLDASVNAYSGSASSNDYFYNAIRIGESKNLVIQDDDSIGRYGRFERVLSKDYDQPVQNTDLASTLLYTYNKSTYSFNISVRDWYSFNLGDIVEVSNMRNGLLNGNHVVVEIKGSPSGGTITLSNVMTDLSQYLS